MNEDELSFLELKIDSQKGSFSLLVLTVKVKKTISPLLCSIGRRKKEDLMGLAYILNKAYFLSLGEKSRGP